MKRLAFLIAIVFLLAAAAAMAEDLPAVKTQVRTLAAFKNGLGFAFRSGATPLKDGWAAIDQLPQASLGALWIGAMPPARVMDVVSYKSTAETEADAANMSEILRSNVGKSVTITYASGDRSVTASGHILSVPEYKDWEGQPQYDLRGIVPRGEIVLVKLDSGNIGAIAKHLIQAVELSGDSTPVTKLTKPVTGAKVRVAGIGSDKAPASAELTVAYLEKGITWSPSYLVNIKDPKKADVTLEAVLANDAEDLVDTDISFVVGYPNFIFADITSPMMAQQTVYQFIQALSSGRSEQRDRYSNVMTQSVMYNAAAPSRPWGPESTYAATQPMAGETNEDLYFYRQPKVTLKKGDRARYTVFTSQVPYEHMYEWTVPDSMNIDDRGYRQSGGDRKLEDYEQVWHVVRLQNDTKQPWTTAPALAVNGSMPVAQDTLTYAPAGGRTNLKLTLATDVRAEQAQVETARKQVTIMHGAYDEVTVDGKLTVTNMKQTPVKMSVTKTVMGRVDKQSDDGKVTKVAKKLTAVNPESEIKWEFELAPKQAKELTYTYTVLINR